GGITFHNTTIFSAGMDNGRTLTNAGITTDLGGGGFQMRTGTTINNLGTWNMFFNGNATFNQISGTTTIFPVNYFGNGTGGMTVNTLNVSGGTLNINGPLEGNLVVTGGTVFGASTISGNVTNSATISPGSSPGILTINGDYTQTASGVLNIEIG